MTGEARVVPAALAVCLREGRVLLVRRRNPPDAGLWGFPGGKVDPGEHAGSAAVRELFEETGIRATEGPLLGVTPVRQEGFAFDLHGYLCIYQSGNAVAADDVDAAEWVAFDEVMTGTRPMSARVDEVLRAALGVS
ncbi:NUDIX domain-containing protein [Maritimibacter sp. DP1N21-5]|uniref:NUDIX domain-containing protein n=1 Tax=Maritimibacter sp. DP1N21-5 TaxID=2836867 RepID=UPI001C44041E|nr:NUDIX domain-containing protein [Maritimibacter sp. DP1N21-5]MBV7410054.1 NUDIX domain-containing protein [Maritimibacter sp. DP1N21-5]